ncbi:hypothetical protein [Reichenbachiella sp. MALMAid0571]|uniref:hypothetical protein n=1 Tax=Reichenbachiella sp. MALMAid0571 TaxID=3143939 RepID=UPI0032E00334
MEEEKKVVDLNININVTQQEGCWGKKELSDNHDCPKIKVGMSVAQLAYFLKMLADLGYIKTTKNTVSDSIRCIIKNISTPKAEEISFVSFKTKYYNPELSTKQSVRDVVIKLMNYLRKELNQ